jgi:hypothetical protein
LKIVERSRDQRRADGVYAQAEAAVLAVLAQSLGVSVEQARTEVEAAAVKPSIVKRGSQRVGR